MGKLSNIDKTKLVAYNKGTNLSKCLLCEKELKGYILGNIKRHYETIHNHNFDLVGPSTSDTNIIKRQSSNQFNVKLNKSDFLKCCVGMVAVKNIPFRIFDDDQYFKQIIQPYENQFNLNLNSQNIVEYINLSAYNIKKHLKQNFAKKMLSLKVDVATRMGKSILGISVQYMEDFKIIINTIGMIQLKQRHTAHSLKEEILKCLLEFDIDLTQIYSTTTDNGSNVLKASKPIQQDMRDLQNDEFETTSENENDDYELLHGRLNSVLVVVRCAAHTLQLAAHDCFKNMQSKLEDCRKVVKLLRANIINSRNSVDLRLPPIDNITRWISTVQMMESLLSVKDQINGNEVEFSIDCKIDWTFIQNFVNVFTPMVQCTKQLQAEQYVIGDFYRDWLVCEAKLKKMCENAFAAMLLESMTKRKEKLLDNVAFLSGLYFDPRFNFLDSPYINDDQKKSAVGHVLRTNATLTSLNGGRNTSIEESNPQDEMPMSPNDPYNILEEEFNNLTSNRFSCQNNDNIRQKLDNLAYGQRLSFATNILDYWKNLSTKDKDLFKLAEVILALPSSQVSAERTFSALSTIVTKQRTRLSSATINNLLIVNLNSNIIEKVSI